MKRFMICFALATVLLAGCRQARQESNDGLLTSKTEGKWQGMVFYEGEPSYVTYEYSMEWPEEGQLPKVAMCELGKICFGDSLDLGATLAVWQWIIRNRQKDDSKWMRLDSIPDSVPRSTYDIKTTCVVEAGMARFEVASSGYEEGSAHGLYSRKYLTIDLSSREVVGLADVINTEGIGDLVKEAVETLDVNREVKESSDTAQYPKPSSFYVDGSRAAVVVVYGLYEIAPYYRGIQEVVMPVEWLNSHGVLTPYGKKLFGL